MKQRTIRRGLNTFNLLLVATFLVLALYSAIGQQIFPHIGQYRTTLEHHLGELLDSEVEIRSLSGGMSVLTPSIHIEGISLYDRPGDKTPSLSIAAIDAELDPRLSLINLTPVFKSVRLSGLSVKVENQGRRLRADGEDSEDDSQAVQKFVEGLLLQQHVELNNVNIQINQGKNQKVLQLDHLAMKGDGDNRLMTGSLSYGIKNKIKASLRIYSQGNPYELDEFYARGVMELPRLDVDYWLDEVADISIFNDFSASAQLGFEFKDGLLNYAKLDMASPKVAIDHQESFENVNAQVWLRQTSQNAWSLWLDKGVFKFKGKNRQLDDLALKLSRSKVGNRWQGFIQDMDLEYLRDLLMDLQAIPQNVESVLSDLNPSGRIQNFSVVVQQQEHHPLRLTLAGELQGVSTQAKGGIPGIKNLDGVLAANKNGGRVQFANDHMVLQFPSVYGHDFNLAYAQGQVDWVIAEHGSEIFGDGLQLQSKEMGHVTGGFHVWLPVNQQLSDTMELNLAIQDAPYDAHQLLVPDNTNEELQTWLDRSLLAGRISNGLFYMFSDLDKAAPLNQIELQLDSKDLTLDYLTDWPAVTQLDSEIFINLDEVVGKVASAHSLGGQLNGADVIYDLKQSTFWLDSKIHGPSEELFSYFQQTPARDVVGAVFDKWSMQGQHATDFALFVPMESPNQPSLEITSALKQSQLNMSDIRLSVDDINGSIHFTSSKGLWSPSFAGTLWDRNFKFSIDSDVNDNRFKSSIKMDGQANTEAFKTWLGTALLQPFTGDFPVQGEFIVNTDKTQFTGLTLRSDLVGAQLDLPTPYGKSKEQKVNLETRVAIKDGQEISLSYGTKLNMALKMEQGQLYNGQVFLGATEAYLPSYSGMAIEGHIDRVNLDQWLDTWEKINQYEAKLDANSVENENPIGARQGQANTEPFIKKLVLSTDDFSYQDYQFKNVKATISSKQKDWLFNVEAPVAKGLVIYREELPLKLDLEYLHWPMLEQTDYSDRKEDLLAEIEPRNFVPLDVSVDEIFIGPTNYGRWNVQVRPDKNGAQFQEIDGHIKKLNVKGQVNWRKSASIAQSSALNLQLSSKDVGGIQKAWRKKPVVEADDANVQLKLNWQGSPAQMALAKLNGEVAFHLKDGRFNQAGDTRVLGAFGLLNFAAVGRRLRLDFSDVYQSGFHFDDVKGKATIKDGIIKIVDTVDLTGPSATFAASGEIDAVTTQLNQELSVTFPLTGTLPFVAILAGFAPPVAASLFVGEKLVGDEIEKFTSATYKLTGSWQDPQLELKKRFDNEIEGKKEKSFWHRMKDVFGVGD